MIATGAVTSRWSATVPEGAYAHRWPHDVILSRSVRRRDTAELWRAPEIWGTSVELAAGYDEPHAMRPPDERVSAPTAAR